MNNYQFTLHSEKRPLAILLPFPSLSGLELFGLRFAKSAASMYGISSIICTPKEGLIWQYATELALRCVHLPIGMKFDPIIIKQLVKTIKEYNPKLLIGFRTQTAYSAHIARLICRNHSPLVLFYRLGAGNYIRRDPIHRVLFKNIRLIVSNSEHVKNKILKYWAISPEKVVCIKSGVDTEKYRPDEARRLAFRNNLKIPQDAILIGNTGRIHPEKGSEILLEAVFGDGGPAQINQSVHLVYIGREYTSGYANKLMDKAQTLGASNRFHILPFKKEIEEVYPGLDIFALAVTSHETYAYVALEAMACGVPPVVPYVGGMKEMFLHGKEGFFFEHRNINSLKTILNNLVTMSHCDRQEIGRNARKKILETASWEKMMHNYFQTFAKIGIY